MTEEMLEVGELNLVHPCLPDAQIKNLKFKDLPMVYTSDEIYDDYEKSNTLCPNFSLLVDDTKNDYDDDYGTPIELLRLVEQEAKEIHPHQEEVKIINLGEKGEEKQVKIGTAMTEEMQKQLHTLLREFKDIFAWSNQDMLGLNHVVVQHKLPLKPECFPIKQKLRRLKLEMTLKIKEEVEKVFNVGFLAIAKYP